MKRNIIKYIAAIVFVATSFASLAQNTNSAYFTDGYLYRHQMNPAFGNEQNFVGFPALGNIDFSLGGNLHLTDVLYSLNGKTTTFLNPGISASEVMGNLSDKNRLNVDFKLNVLNFGFKAFGGYNTFGINLRTNVGTIVPKALFSLAKEGVANNTYDFSDLNVHADAYVELALGHSRQINDQWRVGGTFKFLVGGANLDFEADHTHLELGEDNWSAVTNATIQANLKGLYYEHDFNETTGNEYVDGFDVDGPGVGGFGVALDLGAVYTLNEDWEFSASLLDLGFISWSNNMVASTNGDRSFELDKYTFNVDDEAPNNFEDEFDKMGDDLSALYELTDNGDMGSRTKMLAATLNLAAEYTLPVYRNLTFGLLNSTRFQGKYTWTEFRLSANIAPVKIFSAGINLAAGTYGCSFGWLLNFHSTGFNLFLGMDNTFFNLAKQGVPLNSNASVNFGINFPF